MRYLLIAALVASLASVATADPELPSPLPLPGAHVRLTVEGELRVPAGTFSVPAGTHLVADYLWDEWDADYRRLQERDVRLSAENAVLRREATRWRPGWRVIVGAALVGLATGVYAGTR